MFHQIIVLFLVHLMGIIKLWIQIEKRNKHKYIEYKSKKNNIHFYYDLYNIKIFRIY